MADGYKVTPEHFNRAFGGCITQAKAHGLDVNNFDINRFLVHQAEVIAAAHAGSDFYSNALNEMTMDERLTTED